MAQILTTQAELDAIFKRMESDYGRLNRRQQKFAVSEIGRVRGEVSDLLADFADKDGIIQRRRASRVLRELEYIEKSLREHGEIAFNGIIEESSEWTARRINRGIGLGLSASQFDRVNEYVANYVIRRFGEDGLVLSDRIWGLSGEIRDEMATVIRSGIIKGDGINAMIPRIREVYDNETWKIERVARTESLTAHRAAISYSANESDVVRWVQFHAGDDRSDACVTLAEADPYGKGAGIYKPNDTEIWNPHPNCTSYTTYILDERWL